MKRHLFSMAALLLSACAHGTTERVATPAARTVAPPTGKPTQQVIGVEPAPRGGDDLVLYMAEHFQIVTWARDAVINGELDLMREPLQALASYEYEAVAPAAWMQGVARVQRVAGIAAQAQTLPRAAQGIATLASECGQCHHQTIDKPLIDAIQPLPARPGSESWIQRMQRHGWALDRMWDGLVLRSDNTWIQGANALAGAPSERPSEDPPLAPEAQRAFDALRQQGSEAAEAESWQQRSDAYAGLLVTCAHCHRSIY